MFFVRIPQEVRLGNVLMLKSDGKEHFCFGKRCFPVKKDVIKERNCKGFRRVYLLQIPKKGCLQYRFYGDFFYIVFEVTLFTRQKLRI